MERKGIFIEDTFAEAFPMSAVRLIITADTERWALEAARSMTGFATSVIACGCEGAIESHLKPDETPDGRYGISVMLFAMSSSQLKKHVINRCGQCVMTAPTSALFSGFSQAPESSPKDKVKDKVPVGAALRYFGDGWQISKRLGERRYWRIPVMDGEFLCEDHTWRREAIGGGNFLILAESRRAALTAASHAVEAIRGLPSVILPFPGGVVRSGSKVGSKYKSLIASTNGAFCPTLRGLIPSSLPANVASVMEIVINGLGRAPIEKAMAQGMNAVIRLGRKGGIVGLSAGNYGGKLGPHHFSLREILT
ncbi:MAG: formylmethanofuran--tetrahydromethanopterin N-formyltransferase [Alphaproteobacteria bacterium GM7ARS4]|nr:formylmethanofuran--tetrahydromethanopterin N-formyltransferase [Alphaproteobacteria bacterium GM7ARS4]